MAKTRYDIKKAHEESQAKQSLDRKAKINQAYRDYAELEELQQELDSVAVKYDVNLSQAENDKRFKKPIEDKIKKAKAKLNTAYKGIKSSKDQKLIQEFDEFMKEEEGMAKAINYGGPTKSKPMAKQNKAQYNYGLKNYKGENIMLKDKYASKEEKRMLDTELAKIEAEHGKNSKQYKDFVKNRYEKVYMPELRDKIRRKKDDAQSRFDNASSPEEVKAAKEQVDYYDNVYDFTTTKDPWIKAHGVDDVAKPYHEWVSSFVGGEGFNVEKPESLQDTQEEWEQPTVQLSDDELGTGGQSARQTASAGVSRGTENVDDLGYGTQKGVDDLTFDGTQDYEGQLAQAEADYNDFSSYQPEAFDDTYAPDYQTNYGDIFGTVMDAGRMLAGFQGAATEIPEYTRGDAFSLAMNDATNMRDMGLSAEELAFMERQGEEAYAYDVKNIKRLAGGSAGVALGNLGRAQSQLYDSKERMGLADVEARRQNRQNFQNMAIRDESINRRIFEDDLRQAEMTKQAGAGLVQDALTNMQERFDFNKAYGKGSPFYEYQKERTLDTRRMRHDREDANRRRIFDYDRELSGRVDELRKKVEDSKSIDGTPASTVKAAANNKTFIPENITMTEDPTVEQEGKSIFKKGSTEMSNQELGSNLSAEEEMLNKEIAKTGKSKQQRADEIQKLMMETDDMDELDKLDKELTSLNL